MWTISEDWFEMYKLNCILLECIYKLVSYGVFLMRVSAFEYTLRINEMYIATLQYKPLLVMLVTITSVIIWYTIDVFAPLSKISASSHNISYQTW